MGKARYHDGASSFYSSLLTRSGLFMHAMKQSRITAKGTFVTVLAVLYLCSVPFASPRAAFVSQEVTGIRIAAEGGYYSSGANAARHSNNPVIRNLMSWFYMTDDKSHPPLGDMMGFVRNNGNWPLMDTVRRKIEQEGEEDRGQSATNSVWREWFDQYPPFTDDGKYTHVMTAVDARAKALFKQYWREGAFNTEQQKKLLARYSNILTAEDNDVRLDNLIWDENFERAEVALGYVSRSVAALGKARIALAREGHGVEGLIANVPPALQNDKGLIFERARWRRRNDLDSRALELLNKVGADNLPHPDKWWKERHILARRAIEDKNYALAYRLATQHGKDEGLAFAEGEWLAGWMALNYLNRPKTAFTHFKALFNGTSTPISKSRGSYWSGVAAEKSGYTDIANQWYQVSAQYYETYYGQKAGDKIAKDDGILRAFLEKPFAYTVTSNSQADFNRNELVQAVRLLKQAGIDSQTIRLFMIKLRYGLPEDTGYYYMYGKLAQEIGDYEALHQIGKKSYAEHRWGFWEAAYPVLPIRLTSDTKAALAYAIMRQESAFNVGAQSSAGAKGLMQLMPSTARMVARQEGVGYAHHHLTAKPDYNVRLGQAYLGDLIDSFDGALPMAIAGYNAGPNRVKQWNTLFGDPRKGQISWDDWIESIPISETRNYVQRVLENMRVYHYRLQ